MSHYDKYVGNILLRIYQNMCVWFYHISQFVENQNEKLKSIHLNYHSCTSCEHSYRQWFCY